MAQYDAIKTKAADGVLFFRLGDFYEMFGEDAIMVSRLLNLTLTHRASRPMCGVPYKSARVYIARLLKLGQKVVICEQVGGIPAHGKGLTERKITEVITPGTVVEEEYLDNEAPSYLASFSVTSGRAGLAFIDVTTGDFRATSWLLTEDNANGNYNNKKGSIASNDKKNNGNNDNGDDDAGNDGSNEEYGNTRLEEELGRITPREVLLPQSLKNDAIVNAALANSMAGVVSYYPDWDFDARKGYKLLTEQFHVESLKAYGLDMQSAEVAPAGFLLDYLAHTVCRPTPHVSDITVYRHDEYLVIDDASRRSLEVSRNAQDGTEKYTLTECVNFALTAMGAREIRQRLLFPLIDIDEIKKRQDETARFVSDANLLSGVRRLLSAILDIERLAARISMMKAHPKDLVALRDSLVNVLAVKRCLGLAADDSGVQTAQKIIDTIRRAILDDPATSLTEGRIIREYWSSELDHWRKVHDDFGGELARYEAEEREATGIQSLKVRSTGNTGLFIEVSRAKNALVPSRFILRRSTLTGDRYTTERLEALDRELQESGTRMLELERDLFVALRDNLNQYVRYLQSTAREVAKIDAAQSFAQAAIIHGWVRPVVDSSLMLDIKAGRHPVVEAHQRSGEFVPNNTLLFGTEKSFALVTGPNMAGKSTYLRQNALIVLLAQAGSFVPADEACIGMVDKIFCRVGASDNLARGESTFLVEMTETANILRNATERSLVIMDEVGRGTSTEDGLAIATAVSEHLLNKIGCRTLFATHYRELGRMEHTALIKLCMEVSDADGQVVFLRKVRQGVAASSYGIHVASMAGVPQCVIDRARVILARNTKDSKKVHKIIDKRKSIGQKPSPDMFHPTSSYVGKSAPSEQETYQKRTSGNEKTQKTSLEETKDMEGQQCLF